MFGLTPRAEIAAYIFAAKEAYVSDLVRITGYSKPAIYDALNELVSGGFINQRTGGSGSIYSLPDNIWESFLRVGRNEVQWINWQCVLSVLGRFKSNLSALAVKEASDYLVRSRLLTMSGDLDKGFAGSGLANPFAFKFTIDNVLEELPERLLSIRL